MTAAIYISPFGNPALISDSLVTIGQNSRNDVYPINLCSGDIVENYVNIDLARKSYILDDRTAFSVSGSEDNIKDFLTDIHPLVKNIGAYDRPLRAIGDRANAPQYAGGLGVIGCYVNPDTQQIQTVAQSGTWDDTNLGKVSHIGSGGSEMLDKAIAFAAGFADYSHFGRQDIFNNIDIYIRDLSLSIIADKMVDEIQGIESKQWGGFSEYIYFDRKELRWVRQPPSIFLFGLFIEVMPNLYTSLLIGKCLCYNPGERESRALLINLHDKGKVDCIDYSIRSVLHPNNNLVNSEDYWIGWKPKFATVRFLNGPKDGNGFVAPCITTRHDQSDQILFDFSKSNPIQFGLHKDIWDDLSEKCCSYKDNYYIEQQYAFDKSR